MNLKAAIFSILIFLSTVIEVPGSVLQNNDVIAADSLAKRGTKAINNYQYEIARQYLSDALDVFLTHNDFTRAASAFNETGYSYYAQDLYDSAIYFYIKSLELDILEKDTSRMIGRHRNLGMAYNKQGKYFQALEHYLQSLTLALEINKVNSIGSAYNSIGALYDNLGDNDQSLKYNKLANQFWNIHENEYRLKISLRNIGNSYLKLGKPDSALVYLDSAITIENKLGDLKGLGNLHLIKGEAFLNQQKYEEANKQMLISINFFSDVADYFGMAKAYNALGKLQLSQKKYRRAGFFLQEASQIIDSLDYLSLKHENNRLKAAYFAEVGDYNFAYSYLKTWSTVEDSLFTSTRYNILEIQKEYENNRLDQALKKSSTETLLQKEINKLQRVALIVFLLVMGLLIFILIKINRQSKVIKNQNVLIDKQNWQLNHGIYNKLLMLKSQLERLGKVKGIQEEDWFKRVLWKLGSMSEPHYSYYNHSKPNANINLAEVIKKDAETLADLFEIDYAEIKLDIQSIEMDMFRADHIRLILEELLANFKKHCTPGKHFILKIYKQNNSVLLVIYDQEWVYEEQDKQSGLKMISDLVRNIKGRVTWPNEDNPKIELSIPKS